MPGARALAFASRWFDPATVHRVFEPMIADWQREWQDASVPGRIAVWLRGGGALLISMIAASPNILLTPLSAGTSHRVLTRVTVWTMVGGAPLLIPFVKDLGRQVDVSVFLYLLVLLLPQAVALSFPFAITTVVDVLRTAPLPSREERVGAVKFGIAAVTLMLVLVGWGFPAANQQYRVVTYQAFSGSADGPARNFRPAPGLRELSIVELFQDDRLRRQGHPSGDPIFDAWVASGAGVEAVLREINQRLSLALLPIALMWIRWRALLLPRGRWYSAFPLVASAPMTIVGFYFLLSQSRELADAFVAPRWSGPSLALVVLIVTAFGIDRVRRKAARFA